MKHNTFSTASSVLAAIKSSLIKVVFLSSAVLAFGSASASECAVSEDGMSAICPIDDGYMSN